MRKSLLSRLCIIELAEGEGIEPYVVARTRTLISARTEYASSGITPCAVGFQYL